MSKDTQSIISLLDQLRTSAQTGRNYAKDIHNQERFDDILDKIHALYHHIPNFNQIKLAPLEKIGYITPKIGVNAIIENDKGEILLEKRKDDQSWCIIGGWCETNLSPEENIIKEIKEETGFNAKVNRLIKIFPRTDRKYYSYSSYHILYHCTIIDGDLTVSPESEDVSFWDIQYLDNWHLDHKEWVEYYLKSF